MTSILRPGPSRPSAPRLGPAPRIGPPGAPAQVLAAGPARLAPGVPRARTVIPTWIAPLALVVATLYLIALAFSVRSFSFDIWGGMLLAPILLALVIPMALRFERAEPGERMFRLVMLAFAAKMGSSLVRYYAVYSLYGGEADAGVYHNEGSLLADQFRHFHFQADLARGFLGTGSMWVLTGLVYALVGPTRLGGFFVFAFMAFMGQVLVWRGFRLGMPTGDTRRMARLVLFLPSMLFWPSSTGKDAWMVLCVGLGTFGAAMITSRKPLGWIALAAGLAGTGVVRPHITVLLVGGFGAALLARRSRKPSGRVAKIALVVGVAIGGLALVGTAAKLAGGTNGRENESVTDVLEKTAGQTEIGGSSFATTNPTNPAQFPLAVVNVLFRPFPFEARNPQILVTAFEASALAGLVALGWRRLTRLVAVARRTPIVAFALVYVLGFVWAFQTFGNFGILARQRVQVLPLLAVLLSLPKPADPPSVPPLAPTMGR